LSRDGNNNDPNHSPDGPSSSLRATAAAATTLVGSSEGKIGGCRTTGSTIPYNGGHQTFGEPLFNLDFSAASYVNRSWKDKRSFSGRSRFDEAWQGCAKQCNYEQKCHTYTVHIQYATDSGNYLGTDCYLHNPYKSPYKLDKKEWPPIDDKHGHVSGVCRLN